MGHRGVIRVAAGAVVVVVVIGLIVLVRPGRYVVEGVSMAPGLRPGAVVETIWPPPFGRLRRPHRHERWIVTAPDGVPAIKRVVGLPGETVSIRDGDLTIGGRTVLTPPRVLAELATVVPQGVITAKDDGDENGWHRAVSMTEVLDEACFAPDERRLLMPVRDFGLAVVIDLGVSPSPDTAIRVRLRVGRFVVPWRVRAEGRYAMVAGRLDGHLVSLAWRVAGRGAGRIAGRGDGRGDDRQTDSVGVGGALPQGVPTIWDVARPWPDALPSDDIFSDADGGPTILAVGITKGGGPAKLAESDATIERFVVWRDTLFRPAADGIEEWRLGPDAFFVLGDFPSGSRDSRQWGPLARGAFRSPARLRP